MSRLILDKWNFNPKNAQDIEHMHERVAARFHKTIVTNQGLWIKAGQALGLQAALLPKPYRTAFADIFDDAPTVPYAEIENVIKQDMSGKTAEEIFETFGKVAVNSASIAQVHKATIRRAEVGLNGNPTGRTWSEDVAVKVTLGHPRHACSTSSNAGAAPICRFKSRLFGNRWNGTCGVIVS
jgi:predicted unusual protein kinase regulating ubiquinone biosynthesis (AarF/ABC1/UbiB family)